MKNILFLITLFFCKGILFTQVNPEKGFNYNITSSEDIWSVHEVGNKGWITLSGKTGTYNTKKLNLKIDFYDISMNLKWSVPIERLATQNLGASKIVTSDDKVYHIEYVSKGMSIQIFKTLNITEIDLNGNATVHLLEDVQDIAMDQIKQFTIGNTIYFLNYNGKEGDKAEYFLSAINTKDWSSTRKKLQLPIIKDNSKYDYWNYVGYSNGLLYFYSKGINTIPASKKQNIVYDFIGLDSNGEEKKKFSVQMTLEGGKFISPCDVPLYNQTPPEKTETYKIGRAHV